MPSDPELLHSYASRGDEAAFRQLVERHLGLVHASAQRRLGGNAELAREVSQEVFAALARKARSLAGRTALEPWLYQSVRYAALAAGRAEARRARLHRAFSDMCDHTPEGMPVDWENLRPVLDEAMDELREGDRELMLLRYFSGLSHGEIGARLGLPENTARMRGERALERLRRALGRRGIASTGAALAGLMADQAFAQVACSAPAGLAPVISGVALAGAGTAAAGGLAGAIAFMSTTKVIAVAGIVAAASIGGTVYSRLQVADMESRTQLLEQRCQSAEAQRKELSEQLLKLQADQKTAGQKPAQAVADSGKPGSAAAGGAAPAGDAAAKKGGVANLMDILSASPEYQQLLQRQYAMGLPLEFGLLYRKLGLSPEKVHQMEILLQEQNQVLWDTMAAARSNGISMGDSALTKTRNPELEEVANKLHDLLGDAGFKEYLDYGKSTQARIDTVELAGCLYYTDQPLTAVQAAELVRVIQANTPSVKVTGFVSEGPKADWDKVYVQAQGILSPAQLETLRSLREKRVLDAQMADLQQRLLQSAGGGSPGR